MVTAISLLLFIPMLAAIASFTTQRVEDTRQRLQPVRVSDRRSTR